MYGCTKILGPKYRKSLALSTNEIGILLPHSLEIIVEVLENSLKPFQLIASFINVFSYFFLIVAEVTNSLMFELDVRSVEYILSDQEEEEGSEDGSGQEEDAYSDGEYEDEYD
jgi:hypothetical protein